MCSCFPRTSLVEHGYERHNQHTNSHQIPFSRSFTDRWCDPNQKRVRSPFPVSGTYLTNSTPEKLAATRQETHHRAAQRFCLYHMRHSRAETASLAQRCRMRKTAQHLDAAYNSSSSTKYTHERHLNKRGLPRVKS